MRKYDNEEKSYWERKRKERRWLRGWPEESAEATNKSSTSTAHHLSAIPVYQFTLRLAFPHVLINKVDSKLTCGQVHLYSSYTPALAQRETRYCCIPASILYSL